MARVPITVMGFHCDRCGHEWIPRPGAIGEPRVCPDCHSALWNRPDKKARMSYETFRDKIAASLRRAGKPLTWTEVQDGGEFATSLPKQSVGSPDGNRYWPSAPARIGWNNPLAAEGRHS